MFFYLKKYGLQRNYKNHDRISEKEVRLSLLTLGRQKVREAGSKATAAKTVSKSPNLAHL